MLNEQRSPIKRGAHSSISNAVCDAMIRRRLRRSGSWRRLGRVPNPSESITVMAIAYEDVSDSFRRIVLSGRLDSKGTEEIAVKFAALSTPAKRRVLVDLTGISFLASIGIRAVLSNAKALQNNGGRMVLFVGGNSAVAKTLEATGIDTLVPMFANAAEAEKAALG